MNEPFRIDDDGTLVIYRDAALATAAFLGNTIDGMPKNSPVRLVLNILADNLNDMVGDLRISVGE